MKTNKESAVKPTEQVKIDIYETQKESIVYDNPSGYVLYKNEDVLCFYVDVKARAWVMSSSRLWPGNEPYVNIAVDDLCDRWTSLSFPELEDWEYFCSSGGKTISFTFVHKRVKDKFYGRVA